MEISKLKIALLEDKEEDREEAKRELSRRGFEVIATATPDKLVEWIRKDKKGEIEAALLDWEIGEKIIGPEICQQIKAIRSQVQVYAFTRQAGKDSTRRALRAGFNDYFYKPGLDYDDVSNTILNDIQMIREVIPPLVAFNQVQKDAYYKIVTKADRGREDIDKIIRIAKDTFQGYLKDNISQSLGELFGVGGREVNIVNVLINRIVILCMYKYFDYDDYSIISALRYSPEYGGIARENDIKKGMELVQNVIEMTRNAKLSWEELEDGYKPTDSVFSMTKTEQIPGGARFDVVKGSEYSGREVAIRYEWLEHTNTVIVKDGLKFSKALKQLFIRCGLHRRAMSNPDSLLMHERNLLSKWPRK